MMLNINKTRIFIEFNLPPPFFFKFHVGPYVKNNGTSIKPNFGWIVIMEMCFHKCLGLLT